MNWSIDCSVDQDSIGWMTCAFFKLQVYISFKFELFTVLWCSVVFFFSIALLNTVLVESAVSYVLNCCLENLGLWFWDVAWMWKDNFVIAVIMSRRTVLVVNRTFNFWERLLISFCIIERLFKWILVEGCWLLANCCQNSSLNWWETMRCN